MVRSSSEASAASQARLADRSQGGELLGSHAGFATRSSTSSWSDDTVNVGVSSSRVPGAQCAVSFAEEVVDDDDRSSVTLEKAPPSEGLRAVLRLLFSCVLLRLLLRFHRSRNFVISRNCSGLLYDPASKPVSADIQTRLFHRFLS